MADFESVDNCPEWRHGLDCRAEDCGGAPPSEPRAGLLTSTRALDEPAARAEMIGLVNASTKTSCQKFSCLPRCPGRQCGHRPRSRHRDSDELVDLTLADAKTAARALRRAFADTNVTISHSRALEIVAAQLGFTDWNTASARLSAASPAGSSATPPGTGATGFGGVVPVLRIQDEARAREFYVDCLGFGIEWEHRFEPDLPLYLRIRRGQAVLDLSEHHGDGTPGTVVWVPIASADALHVELSRRPHARLRPGIDRDAPGGPTIELVDPFGNVLRLCEAIG